MSKFSPKGQKILGPSSTKVEKPVPNLKQEEKDKAIEDAKQILANLFKRFVILLFAYDAPECPERCHLPHEAILYAYCVTMLFLQQYNICRMNFFAYDLYAFGFSLIALTKRLLLKYAQTLHYKELREQSQTAGVSKTKSRPAADEVAVTSKQAKVQRIRWLALTVAYAVLIILLLHCFRRIAGRYSLWHVHFLAYPYTIYWIWIRPSFPGPSDDPGAHARIQMKYWWYSTACLTYYAAVLPLQLVPGDFLYYSRMRSWALIIYCFFNVGILLLLQCIFQDLGLNVARANAVMGYLKHEAAFDAKESKFPLWDGNTPVARHCVVQYKGKYYRGQGWINTSEPGSWYAWLHWCLFRNADRCPRGIVIIQAAVTFSLLPFVILSHFWTIYSSVLFINYPLLWWTIHVRRRLLMQTLPISRQLANQSS